MTVLEANLIRSKQAEFTTSNIDSQSSKRDWNQSQTDHDGTCF